MAALDGNLLDRVDHIGNRDSDKALGHLFGAAALVEVRGRPLMIVSDNGTELTSRAILQWQEDNRVEWHYIAPGKPMQTDVVE